MGLSCLAAIVIGFCVIDHGTRTAAIRMAWTVRYAVYDRDLYAGIRAGRGTRENPLTIDDVIPVMLYLRRTAPPGEGWCVGACGPEARAAIDGGM
jgi:hypothetical protein